LTQRQDVIRGRSSERSKNSAAGAAARAESACSASAIVAVSADTVSGVRRRAASSATSGSMSPAEDGRLALWVDGASQYAHGHLHDRTAYVKIDGLQAAVRIVDPRESTDSGDAPSGGLRSPMLGRVVAVHVQAGDRVKRGSVLLAL